MTPAFNVRYVGERKFASIEVCEDGEIRFYADDIDGKTVLVKAVSGKFGDWVPVIEGTDKRNPFAHLTDNCFGPGLEDFQAFSINLIWGDPLSVLAPCQPTDMIKDGTTFYVKEKK